MPLPPGPCRGGEAFQNPCLRATQPAGLHTPGLRSLQQRLVEPGACGPTCPLPCTLPCTHPGRRSPRAAPQRTTHRSAWCTPCQRCSRVPSTSGAAWPAGGRGCELTGRATSQAATSSPWSLLRSGAMPQGRLLVAPPCVCSNGSCNLPCSPAHPKGAWRLPKASLQLSWVHVAPFGPALTQELFTLLRSSPSVQPLEELGTHRPLLPSHHTPGPTLEALSHLTLPPVAPHVRPTISLPLMTSS